MKIIFIVASMSFLVACDNQHATSDKSDSDRKCKALMSELKVAEIKLDSVNKELYDLNTGSGKFINNMCTQGSTCKNHSHYYKKAESLHLACEKISLRFQKELSNSSKAYRISYYSPIVRELKERLDSLNSYVLYLNEGSHGIGKCTNGPKCPNPRHRELYKIRDSKQREFDSIRSILKNIR
jgi:hypothetical protein